MENIILTFNIIAAVLLIIVILLQKSEGGALGIGASQDSFVSSRSAGNFLTKATAVLATFFIVTSIILTMISRDKIPSTSVLEQIEEKQDLLIEEKERAEIAVKAKGDFLANMPKPITHPLNTEDVVVNVWNQEKQRIDAEIYYYSGNQIRVAVSSDMSNVKVVIIG